MGCKYMNQAKYNLTGQLCQTALYLLAIMILDLVIQLAFQLIVHLIGIYGGYLYQMLFLLVNLIIFSVINYGLCKYSLEIAKGNDGYGELFLQGIYHFIRSFCIFIIYIAVALIGYALFIIPGILFTVFFSMVFFIAIENPQLAICQVFQKSYRTVDFCEFFIGIILPAIGFLFLGILTFGIGLLYSMPWISVAMARYYIENIEFTDTNAY